MTIEAVHSTARAEIPDSTVWVPVATGLWAGNTAGNFIGLIEKVSTHGFTARNGCCEPVGLFSSLAEAKRAVESS
ncbi:hypothetical protein SAMN05216219_0788 [Mycetocola miduiensis]|uniref:Uncharacterized protein n=2 Tax=Mycetocola miduiensis TaxID=995034 RepID=A0A1I4ZGT1_9MICO|nr:hypothetical protein SAMN05216219_0788 [Mycetocola miduiensis]